MSNSIKLNDRVSITKGRHTGKYGKVIAQMGSASVHCVQFMGKKRVITAWFSEDYLDRLG